MMSWSDGALRRAAGTTGIVVALVGAGCSSGGDGDRSTGKGTPSRRATSTTTTEVRLDDDLKLNEIQVIGTHNSFHVPLEGTERKAFRAISAPAVAERSYRHRPLTEQFADQGIRQIELDVFADAKGGLYADPAVRRLAGTETPYVDEVPAMTEPGTKVIHEQDVDYRTVCPTFVGCLEELRTWSAAHPRHVPVAVHVQFKDGPLIFGVDGQAVPEKWTTEAMDALDAEIRSVFDGDQLITPDDVRGDAPTLEGVVLEGGWPTLGDSRGKVMFLMINAEPYRSIYLSGHEGLEERILFTNAKPGQPDAAYVGIDDPVGDADRIAKAVKAGYLVRTRADEPNVEARAGDTARRDAALASGAHWVSTDHPTPDSAKDQYGTDYVVALPGGRPARCDPVTAPADCDDDKVEP